MKPPAFAYHRPETVDEAVAILGEAGDEAKVLAGGQSLIPMLNMRLVMPGALVDINRIRDLESIDVTEDGVQVGACVRQHDVHVSSRVAAACPLLGQALAHVAHRAIRSRGTVVGSIAHADPAAELPAVLALLDGSVTAVGPGGRREIGARDLFTRFFETTLRSDELMIAATFPSLAAGEGTAVLESARRHGDFALCGVAAVVSAGSARIAVFGVDSVPRVFALPEALVGDDGALERMAGELNPASDIHASAAFRRHLARVLARRAIDAAAARTAIRDGGAR